MLLAKEMLAERLADLPAAIVTCLIAGISYCLVLIACGGLGLGLRERFLHR